MKLGSVIVVAVVATFPVANIAAAQPIMPSVVTDAIDASKQSCSSGKAKLLNGFIASKDINGDGKSDFVLDYERFECDGSSTFLCGSSGCLMQVFVSTRDRYRKVLDENVQEIKFRHIRGRPAMQLDLHGSSCGRIGSSLCRSILYWNGYTFSPAN